MKRNNKPMVQADLINDIRKIINEARQLTTIVVNTSLTMLYWKIGKRINDEILKGERAEYGKEIIATVSQELEKQYGDGFSYSALTRMVKFASIFPDETIITKLSQTLSWSYFRELLPLEKPLQRDFYLHIGRMENWSVRILRNKIDTMLYERTALSKKPKEIAKAELEKLYKEDQMTPNMIIKDPYILDFLGLKDRYLEKDLEDAILRELEQFLLELGAGFTFVARQKRIQIDYDDFYIDLLFYNRILKRLVALELKLGSFKPDYKGQMELYLRWLDKYERKKGEESPLGLILCASKNQEQIELLELNKSGIHVAEYLTQLPPRDLLKKRLQEAIKQAKIKFNK